MIILKRVYQKPDIRDGERILVDRLWPRGIRRSTLNIDYWAKDVGPSTELRKWFAHDPAKWNSFVAKYRRELEGSKALQKLLNRIADRDEVTFLYSSKDEQHNNAVVLKEFIEEKLKELKKKRIPEKTSKNREALEKNVNYV